MGLPVNSIIEVGMVGSLLNQRILSVFHYAVTSPSTETVVQNEVAQFLAQISNGGALSLSTTYTECLPANATLLQVTAQALTPLRYARQKVLKNQMGTQDDTNTPNVAGVITKQTDFSGRRYIGGVHIPTGGTLSVQDGFLTEDFKAKLFTFAGTMIQQVTIVPTGAIYTPVIYHRPPLTTAPTPVVAFTVQDTSRVMRRRTVGLGI